MENKNVLTIISFVFLSVDYRKEGRWEHVQK